MKKIISILIYAVLFVAVIGSNPPFDNDNMTDYHYVDINVNNDGSMTVKEYYSLNGDYNGSYRNLNYIGSDKKFIGDKDSFEGSDIYNGTGIKGIKVFDALYHYENKEFSLVDSAEKGDYGVYTMNPTEKGLYLKIYNPSSNNTDFIIEYTVEDVVIIHEDVAEIGWDFFGTNHEESIRKLVITFNLPVENTDLKAFTHGPIGGKIELDNNQTVVVSYDFLPKKTPIDVRLVFDKESIPYGTKFSNVTALDKILDVEQDRLDIRNKETKKFVRMFYAINALNILWLIGLIIILIRVYKKYDREEISTFKEKYFREFPADYGPETLDYLLNKNITTKGLSASILELIRRKHLKIEKENKKEYKLILNTNYDTDLSDSEKYLKNWLINEIGNGEEVTIKQINKVSTSQMTASKFIKNYEKWQELIKENNQDKEFFKDNTKVKTKATAYVVITSLIVFILNIIILNKILLAIIIMIGSVLAITYLITFKTRTTKGNEDYVRWQAFKRFLNDFGNFDDKDLPEIVLWEKYLVFASVLGVAKKLEKVMRIKLTNMDVSSDIMDNYTFFHYHHGISGADFNTSLSNSIGRSISSGVTSSRATLGSGGGSSSGGGGFGGGGGGGRF